MPKILQNSLQRLKETQKSLELPKNLTLIQGKYSLYPKMLVPSPPPSTLFCTQIRKLEANQMLTHIAMLSFSVLWVLKYHTPSTFYINIWQTFTHFSHFQSFSETCHKCTWWPPARDDEHPGRVPLFVCLYIFFCLFVV